MNINKILSLLQAVVLLSGVSLTAAAQATSTKNYVVSNTVKQAGVSSETAVNALTISTQGKAQAVEYYDGLGRPLENVVANGSASQKDLITPFEYDMYGREVKKYLSYADQSSTVYGGFKTSWQTDQPAFYNGVLPNVDHDNAPYSMAVMEAAPQERIRAQGHPGAIWQPNVSNPYDAGTHSVQIQYMVNKLEDNVRLFNVDTAGGISSPGFYAAGQLSETVTIDEQQQVLKQFTDMAGQVLLKRVMIAGDSLQTYYIYDDKGQLKGIIQPQGTAILQAAGWVFPAGFSSKWMFLYRYDQRQRMVMRQMPGADSINMIYDQWDRVVLTQDGNLRAAHNFLFTKYDQLNRPIVTGQITDTRALSAVAADVANSSGRYESVNTAAAEGYTLNNTFPSSANYTLTVYTTTHYDSYSNLPVSWASSYSFVNEYGVAAMNANLSGQAVAIQARVLGSSGFNRTVNYFDDKYRIIQTTVDNAAGGKDRLTRVLSFDGKVTSDYHTHTSRFYTTPLVIKQNYTYDHMDRPLTITHQVGSQEVVTISQDSYNEVGQLLNKKLHQSTSHPNVLQKIDQSYTIQGWLSGINQFNSGSSNNYEEADFFSEGLDYTSSLASLAGAQYNGNVAQSNWKGAYDEYVRGYGYSYDQANRLTGSRYGWQQASGSAYTTTKKYDEDNISYDRNGNILTMNRYHGDNTLVDGLTYSNYNGNQLGRVDDGSGSVSPVGFQDKVNGASGNDYSYDANGNLASDYNKSITSITYNFLSLPQVVTVAGKGTITYIYDASGNKLQKTILDQTVTPNKVTNYYYAGAFIYRNDTLELINHPEGRLRPVRMDTTQPISVGNLKYIYDYFLKDHLGNVRTVLTTEQETDLYAATMESGSSAKENALFSDISSTVAAKPAGFDADGSNQQVSRLDGNINVAGNSRIGPAIILKVMAGDTISLSVNGWYSGAVHPAATGVTPIANDLLTLLLGGVTAGGGLKGGAISSSTASPLLSGDISDFLSNQPYNSAQPKAFLNWMVVDEEFKKVASTNHTGAVQMPLITGTMAAQPMVGLNNLVVRRSGWIYVYLSNESDQNVYFDNMVINHKRGPLLEQNDYYSFGATIAGISDKALKSQYAENRYRFNFGSEIQNKEFSDGSGLELYDAHHRMYDPQIGRFGQADPLGDATPSYSPYSFGSNNPISHIDPFGLTDTVLTTRTTNLWPATVYGHKKQAVNWLGLPNWNSSDVHRWERNQEMYYDRLYHNRPLSQNGDPASYTSSLSMYKQWTKAEKEGRAMQAWAVGIMAAPALLAASPAEVGLALQVKVGVNLGAFAVDAGVQTVVNAIEHKNIFSNYNFMSGGAALLIGAPEGASLSNIIGVNAMTSTLGSSVNLSYTSVFGPDRVLSFNPLSILLGTAFGSVGGKFSQANGGGAVMDALAAPFNFTGMAIDEATKPKEQ